MNKIFKICFTVLNVLFLSTFSVSNADAQCSIVGVNSTGSTVKLSISCDFPVYINTGNAAEDDANYVTEKNNWIANHQQDYDAILSLTDSYYEIHEDDLSALSAAKQAAILASPERYHVIP